MGAEETWGKGIGEEEVGEISWDVKQEIKISKKKKLLV